VNYGDASKTITLKYYDANENLLRSINTNINKDGK